MRGLAVSPFSTRPKDPGSYCLARIGVWAGSAAPTLLLGRVRLAPNGGIADRQFHGLPDLLVDHCFYSQAVGSLYGWCLRIFGVFGRIGVGERVLVRTARLGQGGLYDRISRHRHW